MEDEKLKSFLEKIESFKKSGGVDLSAAEDISIGVMNLISLEEHFFFTGAKTKEDSYFDVITEIREMRKRLMESLDMKHEGETWCATKHLLSASMRLIEVGNRYNSAGEKEKAKVSYKDAYKLYSIFWAIKAKLISVKDAVGAGKGVKDEKWSLDQLVEKLADCCNE